MSTILAFICIFASYTLISAQPQSQPPLTNINPISSTQQPLTIISEPFTPPTPSQSITNINIPFTEPTSRLISSTTTTSKPTSIHPQSTNTQNTQNTANIQNTQNTQTNGASISTSNPITTTSAPIITTQSSPTTPTTTTTNKPTPYINPFCPAHNYNPNANPIPSYNLGFQQQQYQFCSSLTGPTSIATDFGGYLQCDNFACCTCQAINCGYNGIPCHSAQFGDSGAVGAQNINIKGSLMPIYQPGTFGIAGQYQYGAHIECQGLESCKNAKINGDTIGELDCNGDFGCRSAHIIINNPAPTMNIECSGLYACLNAKIEINIGETPMNGQCNPQYIPKTIVIGNIQFNGQSAGQSVSITINNRGCDMVMIEHIDCPDHMSCIGAQFVINGNVQIQQCDINGLFQIPMQCLQIGYNNNNNINNYQYQYQSPPQQQPIYPMPYTPPYNQQIYPNIPQQTIPTVPKVTQFPQTTQTPQTPQVPVINNNNNLNPNPIQTQSQTSLNTPSISTPHIGQTQGMYQAQPIPIIGSNVELQCGDLISCAYKTIRIVNPEPTFQLECGVSGACNQMRLSLEFVAGYFVDRIEGLVFSAQNAAQGAVININTPYFMEINKIRCEEMGACNGLTVEVGAGIDVYNINMECRHQGSCFGCTVKQNHMNIPCEAIANGNVGAFLSKPWNPIGTQTQSQYQQSGVPGNQYNYNYMQYPQYSAYPQTLGYP